jgi:two-component system response regulator PilR (NtrC family)
MAKNLHEVELAVNGEEGIVKLNQQEFDVVLSDLKMPGEVDGLELLRYIRNNHPAVQVIMMTAFATTETAIEAMKRGAYDYIQKPFKIEEILALIAKCLEKKALLQENVQLRNELQSRYHFGKLLGKSPQMLALFDLLHKVAQSKVNVLITGENGTGKELVARALHYNGPRSKKPFVPINCNAIPEQLLESELFGHKRGAFTGAERDKLGLFQMADGGTLFLDEIGDLPAHIQVKLLRVLQEKQVRPVGGDIETTIDVRIISATNRDLAEELKENRFREDLYFRLNVMSIEMPSLRNRRDDIPFLAHHFLQHYAQEQVRDIQGISREAMDLLMQYDFPGNVRELKNIMERAVLLETQTQLQAESLPPTVRSSPISSIPNCDTQDLQLPEHGLEAFLANIELRLLQQALVQAHGVRTDAAKLLKISFRSFRYRMAKLALSTDDVSDEES